MKRYAWTVLLSLISFAGCSADEPFRNPMVYGEPLAGLASVEVPDIVAKAEQYEGQTVMIEGVTGSVCQNRGCWMYISNGGEKIRIKFKDYGFFVPFDSEGKRVKAEGIVTSKLVSKETLQHWAEEGDGDPSLIHADATVIMLTASGVVIEDGGKLSDEQKELME